MIFEIKNASIGYAQPLMTDVNAILKSGEVCLLVGNNGVGKTSLIKSILQQIPLLQGEISVNAQSLTTFSVEDLAKNIATVFSKSPLPQHQTVFDLISLGKYIYYPFYFKLKKEDVVEIDAIIVALNLEEYRNTSLKNLSDGNIQKAYIGRAIAQNSPMIILDEPTTHLDEKNKIIILKTLRTLAKEQQKIILFSSHDWRLAKEFADQMWYVKNALMQNGLVEDVLMQNKELMDVSLFTMNRNFVPPHIFAPALQKEMLFSLLQKNYNSDLSYLDFVYEQNSWTVMYNSRKNYCKNIEEILLFLNNHQ